MQHARQKARASSSQRSLVTLQPAGLASTPDRDLPTVCHLGDHSERDLQAPFSSKRGSGEAEGMAILDSCPHSTPQLPGVEQVRGTGIADLGDLRRDQPTGGQTALDNTKE
jgi:hypothetical protein